MRSLRVLIRPTNLDGHRVFVAQCLEFNIAVQGESPEAALTAFVDNLSQTATLVRDHGASDPFDYLGQGPAEAWQAWDEAIKGEKKPDPRPNGWTCVPAFVAAPC